MAKLRSSLLGILTVITFVAAPLSAATFNVSSTDNWKQILNDPNYLQPGDELVFSAGTYFHDSFIHIGYQGTAANPITMRPADGANVRFLGTTSAQNVLNLEGAQYLTLKDFEITGGSQGIRMGKNSNGDPAKFITLDGNRIHDTGAVAVSANRNGNTYEGMHFLRNEIYNTAGNGEGFYLGCNNNACQFYDGIIEQNYIHDLDGPNVIQGDGIEIKDGSYNNIIRDNVIHDTKQPGIIAYGVEEQGARNIIERNVIWNTADHAIQVAADAIVRNNIIFSGDKDGIHSQNHQGAIPGNLTIEHNTIRTSRDAIRIGAPNGGVLSGPIVIANNALYTAGFLSINTSTLVDTIISNNIGSGFSTGGLNSSQFDNSGNLATDFVDFLNMNAFPAAGSKLIGAADLAYLAADDFNTTSRAGTSDVGAYVYSAAGNPGWQIGLSLKEFPDPDVLGDFDGDGDRDGADFLVWQQGFGSTYNADDLADWITNYGIGSNATTAAASVPEPTTVLLTLAGTMLAMFLGKSRFA